VFAFRVLLTIPLLALTACPSEIPARPEVSTRTCVDAADLGDPCGLCDAGQVVCEPTGVVSCRQPEGFTGNEEPGVARCGYCNTGTLACADDGPACENDISKIVADESCQCSESICQMGTPGFACSVDAMDCGPCRGFSCDATDCDPDRAGEACEGCGSIECGGAQGGGDAWGCVPNADIGGDCGNCEAITGTWMCDPQEGMVCDGATNACGGCDPFDQEVGESCGDCARYLCDDDDGTIACVELQRDACDDCTDDVVVPSPNCGLCNQGRVACYFVLACNQADIEKPGDACGGGYLTCVDDSLICRTPPEGWVAIPAGSYCMGTPADRACRNQEFQEEGLDTEALTPTVITHPFFIMTHEVTREAWRAYEPEASFSSCDCGGEACDDANCPADSMNWFAALSYANWRSRQLGLTECYPSEVTGWAQGPPGGLAIDRVITDLDLNCDGFRLPTEAEWEYAARAGVTSRSQIPGELVVCREGSIRSEPILDPVAWWAATTDGGHNLKPVGLKPPNAWGLFDTLGNARELTMAQQYATTAEEVPVFDRVWRTRWQPATLQNVLVRGGGSNSHAWGVGLGVKRAQPASANIERVGLRLVRTVPTPEEMRHELHYTIPTCE
jgi:formylglycine-generating enzyme required for sulfatase activity